MASIKITLGRLVHAIRSKAIAHVSEQIPPGAYHFRVAKLIEAVEKDFNDYAKQERALVLKHGVKDKENNIVSMSGAAQKDIDAFNAAMQPLIDHEITIPYEPIIFSKLGEAAQKALTIADVLNLGPLMVEDEAAAGLPAPTPAKS